jgi:hypothetical protein
MNASAVKPHAPFAEGDPLECAIVGHLTPTLKTNECGLLACFSVMARPRFLGCNELAIGGLQNNNNNGRATL